MGLNTTYLIISTFKGNTMQNQDQTVTKKISKQEYNRQYYLKNKTRWRLEEKKKGPFSNVIQIFKTCSASSTHLSKPENSWILVLNGFELLVLFCLAGTITFFLVKEAAHF